MRFSPLGSVAVGVAATALVLVGCGDDRTDSIDTTKPPATTSPVTTSPVTTVVDGTATAKPVVAIPATMPTELVITDLAEGTGPAAKAGDILLLNYVGVRSEDGQEFDSNFGAAPFTITLGAGGVIPGWDQGLVGVKEGGRRQLDIPAELAYGDSPRGDVIKAGDALTFVVDAVDVISAPDPAERAEVTVEGGDNVTALQTSDLVEGDGDALTGAETAVVYITAYRADTGEELLSSWDSGVLEQIGLTETLPGLAQGMTGMKVGGTRQITIPYELAFGADGNADLGTGLPPSTDLVLVVDLFGAY